MQNTDWFMISNLWPWEFICPIGVIGTWQEEELRKIIIEREKSHPSTKPGKPFYEDSPDETRQQILDKSVGEEICNCWYFHRGHLKDFESSISNLDWWEKTGHGACLLFYMPPSTLDGVDELLRVKDKILKLMDILGDKKVWLDAQIVHEYYYGSTLNMKRILGEDAWPIDFESRHDAFKYYQNLLLTSWDEGIIDTSFTDDRPKFKYGSRKDRLEYDKKIVPKYGNSFITPYHFIKKYFPPEKQNIIEMWCAQIFPIHYLYEMGFKIVGMEFGYYSYGIQVLVAFHRGAASQYGGEGWMLNECSVDLWLLEDGTSYRTYTSYDKQLKRIGGPSPSRALRAWILGFMAGAKIISQQLSCETHWTVLKNGAVTLTPMGQLAKKFANFSLKKHTNRGTPFVPVALIMEHDHGWNPHQEMTTAKSECKLEAWFEPYYGKRDAKCVWGRIPYEDGDYMIDNFFDAAFPGWKMEKPPRPGQKNVQEMYDAIRAGLQTEPFETPFQVASTWGDSFDVMLESCSYEALSKYKVVLILGRLKPKRELIEKIDKFVKEGGILIINTEQIEDREDFLKRFGISFTGIVKAGISSRFLLNESEYEESWYKYEKIEYRDADILAVSDEKDPIIISKNYFAGIIIFTAPFYMQDHANIRILKVCKEVITYVMNKISPIKIEGPPIEYLINRKDDEDLVITLINNSGEEWKGFVTLKGIGVRKQKVYELWEEKEILLEEVSSPEDSYDLLFKARIPKYDFRIYSNSI